MRNPIIDNSQKNNDSISDKVNITSKRTQNALKILENIENDFMRLAQQNTSTRKQGKRNNFLEKIRTDKLQVSIEKNGIEYHKNLIFSKLQKYNELNKKDEVIESLTKKYASSQELLYWIEISSSEIFFIG